jgi:hypothetical protein
MAHWATENETGLWLGWLVLVHRRRAYYWQGLLAGSALKDVFGTS